jgi:hypothetical protein
MAGERRARGGVPVAMGSCLTRHRARRWKGRYPFAYQLAGCSRGVASWTRAKLA